MQQFCRQFFVPLTVCHHRFSSRHRQSFSLQVLGWVFNLLGCQLLPHSVVVVGVCFWLRMWGLMLVSKILGPVWYNHRQMFFPCVKITCRESSNKSWLFHVGEHHFLLWNFFPVWFKCLPSALLIPLLSRAPAEAASLSPSTREQQGVNMHSTCEGTLLSPWLAGVLWGSRWRVGAVHTAVSRVRGAAESPEHVFTLSGGETMHRMCSSTLQPSGSARKGSFQLV